jgi:hypothetical protein
MRGWAVEFWLVVDLVTGLWVIWKLEAILR